MSTDMPKVTILFLPHELLDHIAGFVDLDDKATRSWCRAYWQLDWSTADWATGFYARGVETLCSTSSALRRAARPYRFATFDVARRLPVTNVDPLGFELASLAREARVSSLSVSEEAWEASAPGPLRKRQRRNFLKDQIAALANLPRLRALHLFPGHIDDLVNLAYPPISPATISPFPDLASRITSWTFTNVRVNHVVSLLSISPSTVTSLAVEHNWRDDPPATEPWSNVDWDAEAGEQEEGQPEREAYDLLCKDNSELRDALGKCINLRSLKVTSLVAEPTNTDEAAIHPAWLSGDALPSSITSLSLSLNRFDETVLELLTKIPNLSHLALYTRPFANDLPDEAQHVALPSLLTLELDQHNPFAAERALEIMSAPKLRSVTITTAAAGLEFEEGLYGDSANEFELIPSHVEHAYPSLEEIHLKASAPAGVWRVEDFDTVKRGLAACRPSLRLVPHWPTLKTVDTSKREVALAASSDLLSWASGRIEALAGETGPLAAVEMEDLLRAMSALDRMRGAYNERH
ncbi:hypothetical protein JCM8097_007707 [Rhodosporidiobolus ruineniae]